MPYLCSPPSFIAAIDENTTANSFGFIVAILIILAFLVALAGAALIAYAVVVVRRRRRNVQSVFPKGGDIDLNQSQV